MHFFDSRRFDSCWIEDLNLNRLSFHLLSFRLLNLLFDLLHNSFGLFLLLRLLTLRSRCHLDNLFNIDLDLDLNLFNDLLINGERPIREEELHGHVVIDAEQFACGKWESINLKRFVLVASLLIVSRTNYGDQFY